MKKQLIALILTLTLYASLNAPEYRTLPIPEGTPLYRYGITCPMLRAIFTVESAWNVYAVNHITGASGIGQLMPVMVEDANRLAQIYKLPQRYVWPRDAFDPYKTIEIWYLVQGHYNPEYDYQKAVKIWFGAGVQYDGMTYREYFENVNNFLHIH